MNSKTSFFKIFINSIYDINVFTEYAKEGIMKAIIYILIVCSGIGIVKGGILGYKLNSGISSITRYLQSNGKNISIKNGLKVYPRKLQEQYITYSGTSVSAAYIAGICAIILEIVPELKPVDIHAILKFCSENIDLPKYLQGYGQVSILKLRDKLTRIIEENKRKKH